MHKNRFYRTWVNSGLVNFTVCEDETDIFISAEKELKNQAKKLIRRYRSDIIGYIKIRPEFETSLEPLLPDDGAPEIVKSMLKAARLTGVGPMAAIAGAVSEFAGKGLLKFTKQIILENGGDIFIKTDTERKIGIYAGGSPLTGKIAIKIKPRHTPLGICTSSGSVGHSLSFGKADAVSVIAEDVSLGDACATAAANRIKDQKTIEEALNFAKNIEGIMGVVVIYGNRIGSIGDVELI